MLIRRLLSSESAEYIKECVEVLSAKHKEIINRIKVNAGAQKEEVPIASDGSFSIKDRTSQWEIEIPKNTNVSNPIKVSLKKGVIKFKTEITTIVTNILNLK